MIDFLIFACVFAYVAYRAHMYYCRPELWAQLEKQKHEREMAKEAARIQARGNIATGLAATAAKIVVEALLRKRP